MLSDGVVSLGPAWDLEVRRQAEAMFLGASHHFMAPDFRAESGFLAEVDRVGVAAWAPSSTTGPAPLPGFETDGGLLIEGSQLGRLRLNYSGTAWAFWAPEAGDPVYATLIDRPDTTLFITTQRSVPWISEQDSWDQELSSNALLS